MNTSTRDEPAFPYTGMGLEGLTKREYFAVTILAGIAASTLREGSMRDIAESMRRHTVQLSVSMADALMTELEK
jgi:hypothetical protein